jgi:hypothetical protein
MRDVLTLMQAATLKRERRAVYTKDSRATKCQKKAYLKAAAKGCSTLDGFVIQKPSREPHLMSDDDTYDPETEDIPGDGLVMDDLDIQFDWLNFCLDEMEDSEEYVDEEEYQVSNEQQHNLSNLTDTSVTGC